MWLSAIFVVLLISLALLLAWPNCRQPSSWKPEQLFGKSRAQIFSDLGVPVSAWGAIKGDLWTVENGNSICSLNIGYDDAGANNDVVNSDEMQLIARDVIISRRPKSWVLWHFLGNRQLARFP